MSNKNEVFEYLIDQLRQQINKKDVTSFNVSVQISDLDEVKQVIHNLQQHIAGTDDEIRALKDSLRQQVNSNQCEDLAQEVRSLKNQLRDASELVAELREDNIKKSEHISHLTGQVKELHMELVEATGDVEAYKLIRKGGGISGDPTPSKPLPGCINCGATKAEECEHDYRLVTWCSDLQQCYKCGKIK